jgi:hypothetical protein
MRGVFYICGLAIVVSIVTASAHGVEASCDFRKCMSVCRTEYESACAGMCGRIISLCRQLVLNSDRAPNARREVSSRGRIKHDAQARSAPDRID